MKQKKFKRTLATFLAFVVSVNLLFSKNTSVGNFSNSQFTNEFANNNTELSVKAANPAVAVIAAAAGLGYGLGYVMGYSARVAFDWVGDRIGSKVHQSNSHDKYNKYDFSTFDN